MLCSQRYRITVGYSGSNSHVQQCAIKHATDLGTGAYLRDTEIHPDTATGGFLGLYVKKIERPLTTEHQL